MSNNCSKEEVRSLRSRFAANALSCPDERKSPALLPFHSSVRAGDHEAEIGCHLISLDALDLELSWRVNSDAVLAQVIADANVLDVFKRFTSTSLDCTPVCNGALRCASKLRRRRQ
jgi:hypothetical protein